MKKLITLVVGLVAVSAVNAAAVGWSAAGLTSFANDAYNFYVIGQNGVDSIATITALLDAGTSADSYAFGSGTVNGTGMINTAVTASGKALDAGTYTAFFVLFDSATPTAGDANYLVISGQANMTKTVAATAANVVFAAANVGTFANDASNWKSFGTSSSVPEPTSGLLMLLGMAGLALRRKRA